MYSKKKESKTFKFMAYILSRNFVLYCILMGGVINPIIFLIALWESIVNGSREAWATMSDWWDDMPPINRDTFDNVQENYKDIE